MNLLKQRVNLSNRNAVSATLAWSPMLLITRFELMAMVGASHQVTVRLMHVAPHRTDSACAATSASAVSPSLSVRLPALGFDHRHCHAQASSDSTFAGEQASREEDSTEGKTLRGGRLPPGHYTD